MLTGCATQNQSLITHLQTRVGELERQLELRDEQIKDMRYTVKDLSYEVDRMKTRVPRETASTTKTQNSGEITSKSKSDSDIIRVPVSVSKVQEALKSAGKYDGPIDDKLGAKTRDAIMDFQKEHGLKSDGIIGKRTWDELKTYLD